MLAKGLQVTGCRVAGIGLDNRASSRQSVQAPPLLLHKELLEVVEFRVPSHLRVLHVAERACSFRGLPARPTEVRDVQSQLPLLNILLLLTEQLVGEPERAVETRLASVRVRQHVTTTGSARAADGSPSILLGGPPG